MTNPLKIPPIYWLIVAFALVLYGIYCYAHQRVVLPQFLALEETADGDFFAPAVHTDVLDSKHPSSPPGLPLLPTHPSASASEQFLVYKTYTDTGAVYEVITLGAVADEVDMITVINQ